MSHLFLVAGLAIALSTQAQAKKPKADSYQPTITMEQARATALGAVAGKVADEELEEEGGQWIYTFDIVVGDVTKEVHVDPDSGKVLKVAIDDDEDEHDGDKEEDDDDDNEEDDD